MKLSKLIAAMLFSAFISGSAALAEEGNGNPESNPLKQQLKQDKQTVEADRAKLQADRKKLKEDRKAARAARKAKRQKEKKQS